MIVSVSEVCCAAGAADSGVGATGDDGCCVDVSPSSERVGTGFNVTRSESAEFSVYSRVRGWPVAVGSSMFVSSEDGTTSWSPEIEGVCSRVGGTVADRDGEVTRDTTLELPVERGRGTTPGIGVL